MTSTTTLTSSLSPGDLIDLGENCPPRCVTWGEDGTCWGLVRTRGKARRPETVPYRVMAPVDDDEAWIAGADVAPTPAPAAASPPPRPPTRTAVATDPDRDPVGKIRAVFGDTVEVVASGEELARLVRKLLDGQRRRDVTVLEDPTWAALADGLASGDGARLIVESGRVLNWCERHEPDRLLLGGWKRLAEQVEAFRGRNEKPGTHLVRYQDPVTPPDV